MTTTPPAAPTIEELDQLAEVLASTTAPRLAIAVHTRNAHQTRELLTTLNQQELIALAVVLAQRWPNPYSRPDDGVIDEIAVRRVADGELLPLTHDERVAVTRILTARGHGTSEVSRRLKVNGVTAKNLITEAQNQQEAA